MSLRELSLFSGAGGGLLGTSLLGWRHIGYVEFNDYCQRVIAQRIADGILPNAPIFGDIRAFVGEGYAASYQGMVDIVTGGFPCQPFSVAGKRAGADDARNMWPATIATIRAVRPCYCLLENVPGLLTSGYFGTILGDLAESGYDARWRILSAAELGAPHKRDRLWIVAHTRSTRAWLDSGRASRDSGQERQSTNARQSALLRQEHGAGSAERIGASSGDVPNARSSQRRPPTQPGQYHPGRQHALQEGRQQSTDGFANLCANVADAACVGCERATDTAEQAGRIGLESSGEFMGNASSARLPNGAGGPFEQAASQPERPSWWEVEPALGRVVDGYANRVAELQAAGNAQVASVVRAAWHLLTEDLP